MMYKIPTNDLFDTSGKILVNGNNFGLRTVKSDGRNALRLLEE